MQYINRIGALEEDKVYQLNEEGIVGVNGIIPYEDITEICLKYAPSRYYTNVYRCEIKTLKQKMTLSNRKYVKLATFEYQSAQYNDFLRLIHQQLKDSPAIFHTGVTPIRYWIELLLMLALFSIISIVLYSFGNILIAGIFGLILLFRLVPYYRKNFPQKYSPDTIPTSILPKP